MEYQSNVFNDPVTGTMRNPYEFVEQIDPKTYKVEPNIIPTLSILEHTRNAGKPNQPKLNYRMLMTDMQIDTLINPTFGSTVAGYERFVRVTPTNAWNPNSAQIRYHCGDHIYNPETMQEYEVVMTPTESIKIQEGLDSDAANFLGSMNTSVTGSSATRTAAGTILLMNVQPFAIRHFTEATVYPGSKIYADGADRTGHATYQEALYDCNYVENFEFKQEWELESYEEFKVKFEDMKWSSTWKMNYEKQQIWENHAAIYGNKSYQVLGINGVTGNGHPKRTMQGILTGTQSFVTYYNPVGMSESAWEKMFQGLIWDQLNYYGDIEAKIIYAGDNVLKALANMLSNRRVVDMNLSADKAIVMSTNTYEFMGKRIQVAPFNEFHFGKYKDWLFAWDPTEINYYELVPRRESWLQLPHQRKVIRHYEHKFGITMPKEMNNVLLRTV